ncbi:hypothetical protein COOONC_01359 [Cooperia oncophora]
MRKDDSKIDPSDGRQPGPQHSVSSGGKNGIKKSGRPCLSDVAAKGPNATRRGGPRRPKAPIKVAKATKRGRLRFHDRARKLEKHSLETQCDLNASRKRAGREPAPELIAVDERPKKSGCCRRVSSSKSLEKGSNFEHGRCRQQKAASPKCSVRGRARRCAQLKGHSSTKPTPSRKPHVDKERKLAEKMAAKEAKAKERETKNAMRLEKRKQKLEELERRKKERLMKKEIKEKLLQQKRERRDQEKRKRLEKELQFMCKKRKLDSYLVSCFCLAFPIMSTQCLNRIHTLPSDASDVVVLIAPSKSDLNQ